MQFKSLYRQLLVLGLLAICLPSQAQQTPHQNFRIDKVQRQQRSQLSEKKSFRLSYTPLPDPIPLNGYFRLKFLLQDPNGKLLDGAKLSVDATMPEHNHGMNAKTRIKALGKGAYEVQGLLFHMAGYWEITALIEHGGKREKAIFGVTAAIKPTAGHQH